MITAVCKTLSTHPDSIFENRTNGCFFINSLDRSLKQHETVGIPPKLLRLSSMFFESFLHAHAFLNIFLNSLISLDKLRQKSNNFFDFLLRNNNHTIRSIAEDKISRLDDSPIDIQRDLNSMWFGLGSGSYNRSSSRPNLNLESMCMLFVW